MLDLLDPWDVQETDFPSIGTPAEKLCFLLNYALLAPSGHNSQPWLFKIDDDTVELYADRTRALPVIDPDDRELTISCGAALVHLRLALRHFGYAATVETLPDADEPDLLARLRLGSRRAPAPEENTLFDAIGKRRTNRQAFEQRAVPHSILLALQEAAQTEGAWFSLMQGEEDRNAVAGLIALGDHLQWADKHFRRELAAWAQTNPSHRRDRLPAFALNLGDALAQAGLRAGRTFDLGNGQAVRDRQLAAGSPVLAVLGTDVDTVYDWLMAGSTRPLVCSFPGSLGFLLQSAHRSSRSATHAAQFD